MTTEEQRLSEWLHEQTPQPPRAISLNRIAALAGSPSPEMPQRRRARAGRWAAVLAAAAVVAFVATLLTTLQGRDHDPSPATPSPTPTRISSNPTPAPTAPPALSFQPWNARLITSATYNLLTPIGSSLYAFVDGGLVRLRPSTGQILARQAVPADASTRPVFSGGRVWIAAQTDSRSVVLIAYDPFSLRQIAHYKYPVIGHEVNGPAVAPSGAATLYLGAGSRVYVVDAHSGRREQTFRVADGMSSLSVSPDRTRLEVATGRQGQFVEQLDARTGKVTERGPVLNFGCSDLQSTSAGYFVTCGSGHVDGVVFYPFDRSAPVDGSQGGGGIGSSVLVSGSVAWLGGDQIIACADPRTGHIRASEVVNLGSRAAGITEFSVVDGRLYGYYQGFNETTGQGLVELMPPKACGLK